MEAEKKGQAGKGTAKGAAPRQNKTIKKARKTARNNKGQQQKRTYRIRTKPRFYRPRTRLTAIAPKFVRNSNSVISASNTFDKFSVLIHPLSTEKAMRKMETENTLVYIVNPKSNKKQIAEAFTRIHGVAPRKINTLNR